MAPLTRILAASLARVPGAARRTAAWLGLALLVTWPVVLDPVGRVVGHPEASVGCHVWLLWWAGHHLGVGPSPLIFFPEGGDVVRLYGSDLLSPPLLGALPVPPALAWNLWVWTLLTLAGLGAHRLARRLGAGTPALAGVVVATAPFYQHELFNGTSELLGGAAVLPWFAAALLDLLDRGRARDGARLGILAAAGVAVSVYDLYFELVVGVALVGARLVGRVEPVFTAGVRRGLAVAAAVAGVLLAPAAWLQWRAGAAQTLAMRETVAFADPAAPVLPDAYADLLDWFDPRPAVIPARLPQPGGGVFDYWTTSTVHLGLLALALAAWTLLRRRGPEGFGLLAVLGGLLAMGPWLRVGGEPLRIAGTAIPLPTLPLVDMLPGFAVTALHAYRYASVVVLAVAVLAAMAARGRLGALAVAAVLVETLALSPVPWPAATTPMPASPVLDRLAALPEGAVLSVPVEQEDLGDLGWMLLAQTVHGKPVQDGGIHRRAGPEATRLFDEVPMLRGLAARGGPRFPGPAEAAWSFRRLAEEGYRYVLVRADRAEALRGMTALLGEPEAADDRFALWRLGPEP